MLTSTETALLASGLELTRELQGAGISMRTPAAFEPGYFKIATLSEIKRSGVRIVILMAFEADLQVVALNSEKQGMMRSGWAWITPEEREPIPQLQGWLFLRPPLSSDGMQTFAQQVSDYTTSHFNITLAPDLVDFTYSAALHDAILLYAHAATKVLSEEGGNLRDGLAVTAAIRNTSFLGVGSSNVVLNVHGNRVQSYEVMSYMAIGSGGVPYGGQTYLRDGVVGFSLQGHQGGYRYCSGYEQLMPSSESSEEACKNKCSRDGCWALTYYAESGTAFAKRCYIFMSEEECGALISLKDAGSELWSEPIGEYSSTQQQYTASPRVPVWPGGTTVVPIDYVSGAVPPCCISWAIMLTAAWLLACFESG